MFFFSLSCLNIPASARPQYLHPTYSDDLAPARQLFNFQLTFQLFLFSFFLFLFILAKFRQRKLSHALFFLHFVLLYLICVCSNSPAGRAVLISVISVRHPCPAPKVFRKFAHRSSRWLAHLKSPLHAWRVIFHGLANSVKSPVQLAFPKELSSCLCPLFFLTRLSLLPVNRGYNPMVPLVWLNTSPRRRPRAGVQPYHADYWVVSYLPP